MPLNIHGAVVTAGLAQDLGLSSPRGVMVLSVEAGGARLAAGMLAHDVILNFNAFRSAVGRYGAHSHQYPAGFPGYRDGLAQRC